jgi:hypothetical protein
MARRFGFVNGFSSANRNGGLGVFQGVVTAFNISFQNLSYFG